MKQNEQTAVYCLERHFIDNDSAENILDSAGAANLDWVELRTRTSATEARRIAVIAGRPSDEECTISLRHFHEGTTCTIRAACLPRKAPVTEEAVPDTSVSEVFSSSQNTATSNQLTQRLFHREEPLAL